MKPSPCVQACAILQGADVVLTLLATQEWGTDNELNPVVRGLLEQGGWGIVAFIVLKIAVLVVLAYMRDLSDHRLVTLMWRSAVYYVLLISGAALIWNLAGILL